MQCPSCRQQLQSDIKGFFICPKGDGALITSSQLVDKEERLVSSIDPAQSLAELPTGTLEIIACPNCGNKMEKVDYSLMGVMVDSCMKCHHRWLDRGELRKIKEHEPKLDPIDQELLRSLEEKIKGINDDFDPNPAYNAGSPNSAFGLIRLLSVAFTHSWVTRFAVVVILVTLAALLLYIARYFQP